ncbi:helix-turn-helix domain-containing protein [Planctomycetota bacterium]
MSISRNIKQIRKTRGLTLEMLAARSNLTKGYLSKVENAKSTPPVSTLQSLAVALGVDISELFDSKKGEEVLPSGLDLLRKSLKAQKDVKGDGYLYKPLVQNLKNKYMSPFMMKVRKGKTNVFSHDSEEFGYVLSGRISLVYDGKCFELREGDSFYFDSRKQHQVINRCQQDAVILAINFNYRRF